MQRWRENGIPERRTWSGLEDAYGTEIAQRGMTAMPQEAVRGTTFADDPPRTDPEPDVLPVLQAMLQRLDLILDELLARNQAGTPYAFTNTISNNQFQNLDFGATLFSVSLINNGPGIVEVLLPRKNPNPILIDPGASLTFTATKARYTSLAYRVTTGAAADFRVRGLL